MVGEKGRAHINNANQVRAEILLQITLLVCR